MTLKKIHLFIHCEDYEDMRILLQCIVDRPVRWKTRVGKTIVLECRWPNEIKNVLQRIPQCRRHPHADHPQPLMMILDLPKDFSEKDLPHLLHAVEQAVPSAGQEIIVLSGDLPVWVYAALTDLYNPRPAVATFDARKRVGVIVASHLKDMKIGDFLFLTRVNTIELGF